MVVALVRTGPHLRFFSRVPRIFVFYISSLEQVYTFERVALPPALLRF